MYCSSFFKLLALKILLWLWGMSTLSVTQNFVPIYAFLSICAHSWCSYLGIHKRPGTGDTFILSPFYVLLHYFRTGSILKTLGCFRSCTIWWVWIRIIRKSITSSSWLRMFSQSCLHIWWQSNFKKHFHCIFPSYLIISITFKNNHFHLWMWLFDVKWFHFWYI